MAEKPSYEALEKKVASLEKTAGKFDRMQREFKQTLNLLESLLSSIPTPVFYKDTRGRYMGCNPAFTEIMGVTGEQIRRKTVQDLWSGEQAGMDHQKDLELMESSSCQVYESEVKDKHGKIRPVIYYKNIFRDEVTPIDINELIESSTAMFGRTSKGIRILTKTWPEPLVVEADRSQIEQVLLNIYVNALHAMPGGGELRCATHPMEIDPEIDLSCPVPPGHYVMISISDTGVGMTKDVLQKVFDPFFTTKERGRGTGLGLASAYGIVTNHGGMIKAESRVGQGSTFTIYLPRTGKQVEPEKPVKRSEIF